jgi:hypothetical protein
VFRPAGDARVRVARFLLPRQVHLYRVVVRPTVTFEWLERLCKEMLHASPLLLLDRGPGDSQDVPGTLVAGDRNFFTMAGKAVGDGLPLSDVDGLFPTAVGVLRPDDVDAADARRAVWSLRSPQGGEREGAQEGPDQRADDVVDPVAHRDKGVGHARGDSPDHEMHRAVGG